MKALILAGGKGTRLRPLTLYTPKPVVPIVNRPFLLYQLDLLKVAGITDVTLSLSYQPDKIEQVIGDGSDFGMGVRYITEPNPLGTGGAYRFAAGEIRETTVVLNGDILTDVDIQKLVDAHGSAKAAATIALVRVPDPSAYGLVEAESDGRVKRFLEKPSPETLAMLTTDTINAGIYVLEPSVLDLIPSGENRSFEYDVFPAILERGEKFQSFVLDGRYWRDIGNPASYLAAHHDLLSGKTGNFQIDRDGGQSDIATVAEIDDRSVIAGRCVIKPGARIVNSVLGSGVQVEEKAVIENSVVWAHTRIAAAAEITGTVVGRSCYIGRNASVRQGAVLGDKSTIPDYSRT
ncbi:MAG: NDP-sugar synthase [Acidobacteria bacterium]|nr:NDP-sugar synthase [Acidobacteriota bacterium]MCA1608485.1 NDP-sugar synthase [Acidobacteriota bacterium]